MTNLDLATLVLNVFALCAGIACIVLSNKQQKALDELREREDRKEQQH